MRSSAWLCLLAFAASSLTVLARDILVPASDGLEQEKPWFCHDLECPRFELLNKTEEYETRKYQTARWVSTHSEGLSYQTAVTAGFQKIFKYISGDNEGRHKVAMTSPVTVQTTAGQGPACKSDFLVSFFLPHKYQVQEHLTTFVMQKKPPTPTNPDVIFTDVPTSVVYVAQYGGVMTDDKIIAARTTELLETLKADGQTFDEALVFTAEYDPPYRLQHRHNEIWVAAGSTDAVESS